MQGKDKQLVEETGRKLGLEGSYIPRSYIEQVRARLCLFLVLPALHLIDRVSISSSFKCAPRDLLCCGFLRGYCRA